MASRVDTVQHEIVDSLRHLGFGVCLLSPLGRGAPDLLVCSPDGRQTVLAEVKSLGGRLRPAQVCWQANWPAMVYVWHNLTEALATFGIASKEEAVS